jgi:hypothetical protein
MAWRMLGRKVLAWNLVSEDLISKSEARFQR